MSRWPIVLGNDEIIYEGLISKLKICHCNYPREIENEVLMSIKNNDKTKLVEANKKFIEYLKSDIYDPINIIDVCSKYIFSILTVSKSCNNDLYTEFNNEGILDTITMSCIFCELEERLDCLIKKVCERNNEEVIPYSLIVRKTIN